LPHPMPRRLEHVVWLVKWFAEPGDVIIDPFSGSGTTGIAAMHRQHSAILIEAKAEYVEMAHRRIAKDAPLLAGAPG